MQPITSTNDFVVKFANVNGSGSASANQLFAKSIIRMGVPVAPRNIFPSNIQGLPTWYEVRVSGAGWLGARAGVDLMVAMNPQTWTQDVASILPGGYLFYDSSKPMPKSKFRDDVTVIGVPLTEICNTTYTDPRQRQLFKNIIYVGALSALLDIEIGVVEALIGEQFKGKDRLIKPNYEALHMGRDYVRENLRPLGLRVKRSDKVGDRIFIDGNTAAALGAVYGGATVCAWYPITPSTSLAEAFTGYCETYRTDPDTGKARYAIVQAEDEIASIGIVVGAGWNGARAFTSTSGPGISLMNELLGLAYYTEIPAVIVDVQRTGPSTGMPTRTQQADIMMCAYASHGDTKHIVLFPANPYECFDFAVRSFDLAEQFQTPVFLLSDLDIGMNDWVVPELHWDDDYVWDRGPVLNDEDLSRMSEFFRYNATNDDFVASRTLPGSDEKGAYFIRGSGHDKYGRYTENPPQYQEVVDRLKKKHAASAAHLPAPVIERRDGATIGVITIGSCDLAVREALDQLADAGVPADFLRVRGFPFVEEVRAFVDEHELCFVVEQNRDAQLRSLIAIETGVSTERMHPVLAYGGFPLSAQHVVESVLAKLEH